MLFIGIRFDCASAGATERASNTTSATYLDSRSFGTWIFLLHFFFEDAPQRQSEITRRRVLAKSGGKEQPAHNRNWTSSAKKNPCRLLLRPSGQTGFRLDDEDFGPNLNRLTVLLARRVTEGGKNKIHFSPDAHHGARCI